MDSIEALAQCFEEHGDMNALFDVAILGAGPGGYVAAIRAAQLGARVCVIEKGEIGGTCLNRGCIPSKALIVAAERYKEIRNAARFGLRAKDASFDWYAIIKRKDAVVEQLRNGISFLFKKHKIELVTGTGLIVSPNRIDVALNNSSPQSIEAQHIIIATGSEPAHIPTFHIDGKDIITSTEALSLPALPKSMLIVGGGVIGAEFATLFASFGVEITILEALPRMLATTDLDETIAKHAQALLKRSGVRIVCGIKIKEIHSAADENLTVATLEDGSRYQAEKTLVSIGRSLNTKTIGIENCGVTLGRSGEIIAAETMQTTSPGIYAIGDITGKWQLAHVASHQGMVAAANIMGRTATMNYDAVPNCIFTSPPAAYVGISEQAALERGEDIITSRFSYKALGRAHAQGETEGLVKIIARKRDDKILGAHILGSAAPELIHEISLALRYGVTAKQIAEAIHAHPTFSEGLMEACENLYGLGIHS
jgi:dihydrolipoamide dehydrogenase